MLQAVPSQCSIRAGLLPPTSPHALHPAAQISLGEIARMLLSTAEASIVGLVTTFHAVPFQCSMTGPRPSCTPAAHTLLVASAVTARREALGAETRLHCCPLKCKVSAASIAPPIAPTAQMSEEEIAATSVSSPPTILGTTTTLHFEPSKCSTSGIRFLRPSKDTPTANTLLGATALSEFKDSPFVKCGLATTLQADPLKCWICENLSFVPCPTAQTFAGEITATLFTRLAFAIADFVHVLPLKCNATELVSAVAQMSFSESADSEPMLPISGAETNWKITGAVVEAML